MTSVLYGVKVLNVTADTMSSYLQSALSLLLSHRCAVSWQRQTSETLDDLLNTDDLWPLYNILSTLLLNQERPWQDTHASTAVIWDQFNMTSSAEGCKACTQGCVGCWFGAHRSTCTPQKQNGRQSPSHGQGMPNQVCYSTCQAPPISVPTVHQYMQIRHLSVINSLVEAVMLSLVQW